MAGHVVLELIGLLVMLMFVLSWARGSRIDVQGRPALFKAEVVLSNRADVKKSVRERFFLAHFRHLSSVD